MTVSPFDVADELDRLAAEIKSLSLYADRVPPTDRGADVTYRQAHEFGRRLARLGFEAYGEPLLRLATARNSWSGRAALLRAAADMARSRAAEIRERARDDERRAVEGDEQRDYAEERANEDDEDREFYTATRRIAESPFDVDFDYGPEMPGHRGSFRPVSSDRWRPVCECGWTGSKQTTRVAALRVADDHVREMIARAARVSEDDDLRAVDERVEEVEYALALLIGTGRDAIVKDAREALGELARLARGEEA